MKKILLLGGSRQQIIAIEMAKKLGYYTILCDYLPDNPGQNYSDKFYLESTTDKEAILKIAKEEKIDGIVAYASDPAAPTAAYVAEKLGLPTNPYKSVNILCNKDLFREFLKENNFCTPKAKGYSNIMDAKNDLEKKVFQFPVLVKPVDSSGSKGVKRIDDLENFEEIVDIALGFSKSKRFIIEEYVEKFGYQIAGDGFVVGGKLKFRCFGNDHFDSTGINPYVPISASFPYNMPKRVHDKIHNEIQRLLTLLNMSMGAYNFDIRIDKNENVYLMEIGPRNGGNFIPQVTRYITGVDMIEYTIKAAVGENCDDIELKEPVGYYSYYALHSSKSGILKEIIIDEKVEMENILEKYLNYNIGEKIPAFTGANGCLGIFIMKFSSMEEMLDMMDNSEKWIKIILEEK